MKIQVGDWIWKSECDDTPMLVVEVNSGGVRVAKYPTTHGCQYDWLGVKWLTENVSMVTHSAIDAAEHHSIEVDL